VGEVLTDRESVLSFETRVSAMVGEEMNEYRRELAEKDALVAEMAATVLDIERLSPWAKLPYELLGMVLEKLQEAPLAGDWGGVEGSHHVRLVSREWRGSHDALVTRLAVSMRTTDQGMWLLARRFPAVVSKKVVFRRLQGGPSDLTDEGMRAVSSLTGLKSPTSAGATTRRTRRCGR
jgi:hypothetical protein